MAKSVRELERIFNEPWFDSLGAPARDTLLSEGRQISASARSFVIRRGDLPNGFYGVIDGTLTASSVLEDGRQMIFGLLESGDWFGEASSIDGLARSHDIVVLRSAQLLHIPPRFIRAPHERCALCPCNGSAAIGAHPHAVQFRRRRGATYNPRAHRPAPAQAHARRRTDGASHAASGSRDPGDASP